MDYKKKIELPHYNIQIVNYFESFKPVFFITLVFREELTRKKAEIALCSFLRKMNNRFFIRSSGDALRVLPVIEIGSTKHRKNKRINDIIYKDELHINDRTEGNWHIHLIMEDPSKRNCKVKGIDIDELKDIIGDLWDSVDYGDLKFTARSDNLEWFKEIYSLKGLVTYVHKEVDVNEDAIMFEYANNSGKRM